MSETAAVVFYTLAAFGGSGFLVSLVNTARRQAEARARGYLEADRLERAADLAFNEKRRAEELDSARRAAWFHIATVAGLPPSETTGRIQRRGLGRPRPAPGYWETRNHPAHRKARTR